MEADSCVRIDSEKLLMLERAATDLMSPPYAVRAEKRREAEAIFMDLKKTKLPYDMCKFILEQSGSDYVLFQAGSTMREAIIREWEVLSVDERDALRGYILHYITTKSNLAPYVREQLLHTVALVVKRATLDSDRRKLFNSVFTTVSQLLMMTDAKMRQLGCSLLSALLTEYANSSGASNVGLPIQFHVDCKIAIQDEELLRILHFAVQFLRRYVSIDLSTLPSDDLTLFSGFLRLLSKVLNWDFQRSKFSPVPLNLADVTTVILRPPRSYAPTFLDPSFLDLLFSLLGKVCLEEDLLHHVVMGLTQLASLTRPVLSSVEEHQSFLGNFVSGILTYISSRPDLTRQEVHGLSCVLRRLATNFCVSHFASLPSDQLPLLVTSLTQLTCLCAHRSVVEDECSEDSLMYVESLEHYLEVFVNLLEDQDALLPPSLLPGPSLTVFDSYLKSKLVSPRGWRRTDLEEEEGEIFELDEEDREAFSDQLRSVGCVARSIPSHSLPLLTRSIAQSTETCLQLLEVIGREPGSLFSQKNTLEGTYDDLHWLIMIAAYTLCDIVKGEEVLIPAALMRYSVRRHKEQGSEVTVQDVAGLVWREGGDQVDLNSSGLDPIISLFLSVCRVCVVEKMFVERGLVEVLSPQVGSTVAWCLGHIAHPYLHLTEDSYEQVSLPLLSVFGRDSASSHWLCLFLLDKVVFNLSAWSGEEKVAVDSVALLGSLAKNAERAAVMVKCDLLWSLMRGFSSGEQAVSSLPPRAQRDLVCSLVQCGVGETRQQFLTELLQPLQRRFLSLVQSPTFPSASHDPPSLRELLSLLEALCGLAHNTTPSLVQEFFDFLHPLMQATVQLLEVYSDSSEVIGVILELFALTAENYVVFMDEEHTLQLYKVCLDLIRSYAHSNTSKYSSSRVSVEEEEQCEDLLQFMKMMTHLTIKDYVDFGDTEGSSVRPVDVVIAGLNTILPLMNEEILKFPSLCLQFYTLINYICESFPDKLPSLPDQLFLTCMHLLETGLHHYGVEVRILCLESIEGVASCGARLEALQSSQTLSDILEHFLKVIFDLMLSSTFDMDTIHSTSGAVYAIICSHKESYLSLANTLISAQTDPQNQTRLVEAFSLLTPPLTPS